MLLPETAKAAIAKTFYDKVITVYARATTFDAEGGIVKGGLTEQSTFNGNVQFTNLGELQTELGLAESIDIAVSCPNEVGITLESVIGYNGVKYEVTAVIPFDLYTKVIGKKCLVV